MCIAPITMKQHGAINTFPCGRCLTCLQKKRADWSFRLLQELSVAQSAYFITLTYSDENVPRNQYGIPQLNKRDLQLFKKRLRKFNKKYSEHSIRYYSVGEYGTRTHRPHYHSIMFNLHPKAMVHTLDIWELGNVQIGTVNASSIHYTTKYVINRIQFNDTLTKPFATMSRRPGIGHIYYERMRTWHREDMRTYVVREGGFKQRLPRYFKDKIFTRFEKQMIALQLNQEIDKVYIDEIERLMNLHHDPCGYYDERQANSDRLLLQTMNAKNKI